MSAASDRGYPDSAGGKTFADCVPYLCGADPLNMATHLACSQAGYAGVISCADPICAPFCPNEQIKSGALPSISKIPVQSIIGTAPPTLTPQNIVTPVPDITKALLPASIEIPCSSWDQLNQSIMDNPMVAAGILGLAFFVLWRSHGR